MQVFESYEGQARAEARVVVCCASGFLIATRSGFASVMQQRFASPRSVLANFKVASRCSASRLTRAPAHTLSKLRLPMPVHSQQGW